MDICFNPILNISYRKPQCYKYHPHVLNKNKRLTFFACGVIVYVEVLRPSQPNEVISSAVSLPNHTFTGQA